MSPRPSVEVCLCPCFRPGVRPRAALTAATPPLGLSFRLPPAPCPGLREARDPAGLTPPQPRRPASLFPDGLRVLRGAGRPLPGPC